MPMVVVVLLVSVSFMLEIETNTRPRLVFSVFFSHIRILVVFFSLQMTIISMYMYNILSTISSRNVERIFLSIEKNNSNCERLLYQLNCIWNGTNNSTFSICTQVIPICNNICVLQFMHLGAVFPFWDFFLHPFLGFYPTLYLQQLLLSILNSIHVIHRQICIYIYPQTLIIDRACSIKLAAQMIHLNFVQTLMNKSTERLN